MNGLPNPSLAAAAFAAAATAAAAVVFWQRLKRMEQVHEHELQTLRSQCCALRQQAAELQQLSGPRELQHQRSTSSSFLLAESLGLSAAAPSFLGLSAERLDRIEQWVARQVKELNIAPFMSVAVSRYGKVCYMNMQGQMDCKRGKPVAADTLLRIYSMTKPITSLAMMLLLEQGCCLLDDPVHKFIPAFANMQVVVEGAALRCAKQDMTIRHLLTHTSGLAYTFVATPLTETYTLEGIEFNHHVGTRKDDFGKYSLEEMVAKLAKLPLLFDPGEKWCYSAATDVLGRLVEIMSGVSLEDYFRDHIFTPLGMSNTFFTVPKDKVDCFAACYATTPDLLASGETKYVEVDDPTTSLYLKHTNLYSGGGGLVSCMTDYLRFTHLMLNGKTENGAQLVSRATLDYMMSNQLNGSMQDIGYSKAALLADRRGHGFGCGGAVVLDASKRNHLCSVGEFSWGGAASTAFWVDRQEQLVCVLLTQVMPSSAHARWRDELRTMVNQAIVG